MTNKITLEPDAITGFHEQGFILIGHDYFNQMKKQIEFQLKQLALNLIEHNERFATFHALLAEMSLAEILSFCVEKETDGGDKITPIFYDFFPQSFALLTTLCDEVIIDLLKQLGLSTPAAATIPVTRIDRPNNTHFLTPMHQDFWYTLNSHNSVTVWFPIYECLKEMGYLSVVPGSHKLGLVPFKQYEQYEPFTTVENFDDQSHEVKVEQDQILIFDQKVLHKSSLNTGTTPRLSVQLRYNDISNLQKQTPTFRPTHSDYVTRQQSELLTSWKKNH